MVTVDDQQAEPRRPDAVASGDAPGPHVRERSAVSLAPASALHTPGLTRGQRARELGVCPTVGHCVLRNDNLALALMHDPAVLLLDEPHSGFDRETYVRFWEMAERRRSGW